MSTSINEALVKLLTTYFSFCETEEDIVNTIGGFCETFDCDILATEDGLSIQQQPVAPQKVKETTVEELEGMFTAVIGVCDTLEDRLNVIGYYSATYGCNIFLTQDGFKLKKN